MPEKSASYLQLIPTLTLLGVLRNWGYSFTDKKYLQNIRGWIGEILFTELIKHKTAIFIICNIEICELSVECVYDCRI